MAPSHNSPPAFEHARYHPFWWQAAPLLQPVPVDLHNQKDIDVVIVGGGFTGISAALTLAQSGKKTLLLDQGAIGFGASTRNGGQIGSGNQKIPIGKLEARFGAEKAKILLNEGVRMLTHLKQLIADKNIDCDLQEVGRFRGAVRPEHYDAMAREMEALNKRAQVAFEMIPRSEQHREVNTDFYYGGYLLPGDGLVHPGKLHHGITMAAQSAGALLQANCCVRRIQRKNEGFELQTDAGSLFARNVILATNGYGGHTGQETEKRIVPVGSAIIATEEMPVETVKSLIPNLRAYGNSARAFHYFRASPDGKRILWGGRVGRWGDHVIQGEKQQSWEAFQHLRNDMLRVFPELQSTRIEFCWSGLIGYSFDDLPHLGVNEDGIHFACGYCGTGVTRSVYLGAKIAERVIDQQAGRTPFDETALPSHPFQALAPKMVPVVERWYRLKDWAGL
ncbi:MAG: FAD-binding oxidoreductase [Pseudomonadales bacterium]|jgi:glycine/D-amino acid oxidase-like deaminating enzyme